MAQMLRVAAGEIRYPVAFLILVVIDDFLFHTDDRNGNEIARECRFLRITVLLSSRSRMALPKVWAAEV
jgi:hypothetical protein